MIGSNVSLDRPTGEIVDAAAKLHVALGPGLPESVYEQVLVRDLARREPSVETQKPISFDYDGLRFAECFRLDIPVANRGLLMNFGAPTLKDGHHRLVNNLEPSASPRLRVSRPATGTSGPVS